MADKVSGRVASPPGSRPSDQAAKRLDAPRFDPSREPMIELAIERERAAIASWLLQLDTGTPPKDSDYLSGYYAGGKAALKLAAEFILQGKHPRRDSDQSGEAGQTPQAAGPEGRERGPSEASASPEPDSHPSSEGSPS